MSAPTETPPRPVHVTNQELGELIGLSHSSISRIRSGERGTSTTVMLRLEEELGWELHDQIKRRDDGTFPARLEELLLEWKAQKLASEPQD